MVKLYIHIWKDQDGISFIQEQNIGKTHGVEFAVDDYWQQQNNDFKYMYTICLNEHEGGYSLMNIQDYIKDTNHETEHLLPRML